MSGAADSAGMRASAFWDAHCAGPAEALVRAALAEDLGEAGDITTATVAQARGIEFRPDTRIVARERGIVCGIRAAQVVCVQLGAALEPACVDGEAVRPGAAVARVHGPPGAVLAAERTLLNVIGLLSGTATLAGAFVQRVQGTRAAIMDTRKTLPGMRALQKYAVLCGGGVPHRMGLHDAFLAKDNHLSGLDPAGIAALVRQCAGPARSRGAQFVECEVDSLDQLDALLALEPGLLDVVLLDNFTCDALQESVARRDRIAPHVKLEASGGITLETVAGVARTGVDRISVGALTHSVRSIDFGLDAA
jgi:nicotinate-nucleotide pyrophosphorylase (carboxylating)